MSASDIRIRVITFCVDLPACHLALRYFMRAWKLHAGDCYARTAFSILLQETASRESHAICDSLATRYPLQTEIVSSEHARSYRNFWPLAFLELAGDEDLVIYCPPHVLVSGNLDTLIEQIVRQDRIFAGVHVGLDAHPHPSPMWFAAFPKNDRLRMAGVFPASLNVIHPGPLNEGVRTEMESVMARTFEHALNAAGLGYRLLAPGQMTEAGDRGAGNDAQPLLVRLTDGSGRRHQWREVFSSYKHVQGFLDDAELPRSWFDYRQTLIRLHRTLDTSPPFLGRNFFHTAKAPYYIFALDYIQQSAGVRALHYLCHALNESGQEAYLTCRKTVPHLRTPLLSPEIVVQHQGAGRKSIIVYPEIISGDPFGMSGVVVRWLLNKPGLIGGDTTYHAEELVFAYDPNYLPDGMDANVLHIPTWDLSIFNNDNNPQDQRRDLTCFYAHKYLHEGYELTHHVEGAISLCKDQTLSHQELAAILRRSRAIYVYEPTAMISEALLCGCPVAIVVTDYWRNHAANYSYTTEWGITMEDTPSSLAVAASRVANYRMFYEDVLLRKAWEQVDSFIELTQQAVAAKTGN
jgi:hypothetical protein